MFEPEVAIMNILLAVVFWFTFDLIIFYLLGPLGIAAAHDFLWPFRFWEEGAGDGVVARNVWIHRFPH